KLTAYSPDFGEAEEQIEVQYAGEEMTIGFNSRYVLDALGAQAAEQVVLELKDGLSPGIIKSFEEEGLPAVIMPLRIWRSHGGEHRVLIQWITIAEFRNYRSLSFHPEPGLNVLSGPNA